jgi:tripartite-type tricarboxylate transporter receptor subunit TctC
VKLPRRQFLRLAAGVAALPAVTRIAGAQTFPTRPITLIVPYPAGGGTDTVARIIAEPMRASLGRPIIIENIGGANGSIGVGRAARATPDGYTLNIGQWGTHVANGVAYKLEYDLVRDFEPISLIARGPFFIVARKSIPANDLKGLLLWLKANPGKVTAGNSGVGSPEHVGAVLFQNSTGTSLQLVPYRGSAPALQDLVAGQIDMMIEGALVALPQVRAGSRARCRDRRRGRIAGLLLIGLGCPFCAQRHSERGDRKTQCRRLTSLGRSERA